MDELQGTDLAKELKRAIREATNDAVPAVRAAIMAQPTTTDHKGKASLRRAVAMAVKRKINLSKKKAEVWVQFIPQGGYSNLGRLLQGEISPWKHPIFGREDTEVTQRAHPYFYSTLVRVAANVQKRIQEVAAEYERKIR